jgi:hypothetical protein
VIRITAPHSDKVYQPQLRDRSSTPGVGALRGRFSSSAQEGTAREEIVVSRFENPAQFDTKYPNVAPTRGALATFLLLAALLAYAGGFMVLYPLVANSVAESVSAGNDPALLQFVGL